MLRGSKEIQCALLSWLGSPAYLQSLFSPLQPSCSSLQGQLLHPHSYSLLTHTSPCLPHPSSIPASHTSFPQGGTQDQDGSSHKQIAPGKHLYESVNWIYILQGWGMEPVNTRKILPLKAAALLLYFHLQGWLLEGHQSRHYTQIHLELILVHSSTSCRGLLGKAQALLIVCQGAQQPKGSSAFPVTGCTSFPEQGTGPASATQPGQQQCQPPAHTLQPCSQNPSNSSASIQPQAEPVAGHQGLTLPLNTTSLPSFLLWESPQHPLPIPCTLHPPCP